MLEPQRSQYLRALGIDVYVPRFILSGAAESSPSLWDDAAPLDSSAINSTANPAETASVEAIPARAVAGENNAAAAAGQRALPADLDFEIVPTPRRASSDTDERRSTNENAQTVAAATPKFALSVVVSAGILLIDDAPANNAARGEYLRLLGNILAALRPQAAQPQLDIFLWPAVKHPQLDQGAEAARETLAAHLQKQIQQHAIDIVLVLGSTAQQWCAFDKGDDNRDNLRCVSSVSALACLREPQNKRQLWQDIRHLAAAQ